MERIEKDARLINELGGPAKIAHDLGFKEGIGTQRVNNWITRGIPSKVLLENFDYFKQGQTTA